MADAWGDGWNGNAWAWTDSAGIYQSSGTLLAGASGTAQLCVPTGLTCMTFSVSVGTWASEVSWALVDSSGVTVATVRTMCTPSVARFSSLHRH